jgi:ABC-type Fe3+/spermidine/putrescine transport system ATPase subunit
VSLPYDGHAQGNIALAVRPEKISISKKKLTSKHNLAANGKIVDWAYYGENSHMIVATQNGQKLGVVIQNSNRESVNALDIGDDVYLSWSPIDTLILID